MASCLGICVKNNIIQYAKISREHEETTVDVFGIKISDSLETSIEEIITETQSQNANICLNLNGEIYNYFSIFSMLKKKDLASLLSSEFEMLCEEKKINFNLFDSRYILSHDYINKDKSNVIYISVDKTNAITQIQKLQKYKITNLTPLPVAISNLVKNETENVSIINIEDNTTITTISNNEIVNIDVIENGMKQILQKINAKENDLKKAYEICKNTTIYTMETSETSLVENAYLEDIMPELYEIVLQIKEKLESQVIGVQKVYITGSGSVINNIDLYFQEYLTKFKCEILVPYFIDRKSKKINVRDYLQVNSAIALGMQGLGDGFQEANFKNDYMKGSFSFKSVGLKMSSDISAETFSDFFKGLKDSISFGKVGNLNNPLGKADYGLIKFAVGLLTFIIIFIVISVTLEGQLKSKTSDVDAVISDTNQKISELGTNIDKVNSKKTDYTSRISRLQDINAALVEEYKYKNAIPNLLNQIMASIPSDVKLTLIQNDSANHIVINAESNKYESLGYFVAVLKLNGILTNVTTNVGDNRQNDTSVVKITIGGDLP
ncbi:MAG: hypothetical protein FWF46_06175 [Oscillospiraceae bacterium]|nr:hypothetical protein [Oscillospiraceae bacterium]